MSGTLDHIVINVRHHVDRAEELLTELGFCLTPRGFHSLGSSNHLMMFEQDYFEILGMPKDDPTIRPDLYSTPFGLNSIVFKTDDADKAYARLDALGMAGDPPRAFTRPVDLDDGTKPDASFRTVTARGDAFPAGRLYFCEHHTPELLWRPEWLSHPGGITGFTEYFVVTGEPDVDAGKIGELLEIAPERAGNDTSTLKFDSGFRLTFLKPEAYTARFGNAARTRKDTEVYFGALGFACSSTQAIRARADALDGVSVSEGGDGLLVSLDELDTLLVFSQ